SQVDVKPGQSIEIDFTAGRGQNGLTATVDISASRPSQAEPLTGGSTGEADASTSKAPVERLNGKVVEKTTTETGAQASQEAADASQD
ncbi:hypothetical protein, partial [Enterococcus faecium]